MSPRTPKEFVAIPRLPEESKTLGRNHVLSVTESAARAAFFADAQEVYWGFGEAHRDPCHFCL